jgi:hypothetical protein
VERIANELLEIAGELGEALRGGRNLVGREIPPKSR